jgi:O-antigen/teichoic acid export membrane protein
VSTHTENIPEVKIEELAVVPPPTEPTGVELIAISIVRRIPGLGGLSTSRRVLTAFRGGSWTMVGYGATQVVRLASTLVLARMVTPQAFGLVALVNVFLSGLESLSDLGIGMDVIQNKRGDDPLFINTAFIIQMIRGTLIWIVAAALAYPFAIFYKQPAVLALAVVGSLSTLIRGFSSGSIWTLTRHVRLKELTCLNTGSEIFGLLVSVVWALFSPTAWALVAGRVAATLALTIASHVIADDRVSFAWDPAGAREILAFGTGIFVSTATYFLAGEAERLVVGKFVTLIELGCFALALSISTAGSRAISQVLGQVFFPMMSDSIRENPEGAYRHYAKTRHLVLLICACMSVGFILGSHWVVHLLLGQKYAQTGWMLQLLGARAALDVFASVAATMLFAIGTSRFAAIGNIVKLAFLAVGLTVAFGHYGFYGAMWVLALAPLANYIPMLIGLRRKCAPVFRDEVISFVGFALATALGAAVFMIVR